MSFLVIERFRILTAKQMLLRDMPEEAYKIYRGVQNRLAGKPCLEYASAIWGEATIMIERGRSKEGEALLFETAEMIEGLPASPGRILHLAGIYNDISIIFRHRRELSQAEEYLDRSLKLFGMVKPSVAAKYLGNVYINRMILCIECGDLEGFKEALSKAVHYNGKADRMTFSNIDETLRSCLEIIMERSIRHPMNMLGLLNDLLDIEELGSTLRSVVYEKGSKFFAWAGEADRALEYALNQMEQSTAAFGKRSRQVVTAYVQIAECCLSIEPESRYWKSAGEFAHKYGYKALYTAEKCFPYDSRMMSEVCFCLASVLLRSGQYDEAARYIRQSIDKIRTIQADNSHPEVYSRLNLIINVCLKQGKFQKAFEYAEHVLKIAKARHNAGRFELLDNYRTATILALKCGNDCAVEFVKEMMVIWPQVLMEVSAIPQEDLRLSCIRRVKDTANLFFSTAFRYQQAFSAEKLYEITLKTNHIDSELNYNYARFFQNLQSPELQAARERISEKEKTIAWLSAERKYDTPEFTHAAKQLESARGDVLKIITGNKLDNGFDQRQLESIQAALKENEIILEYVRFSYIIHNQDLQIGVTGYYCAFAITKNSVEMSWLGKCTELDSITNNIVSGIETEQCVDEFIESAVDLLLTPFQRRLKKDLVIYIVPDSVLYTLPFELLLNCVRPAEESLSQSIVYLSSGRDILRSVQTQRKGKILILANPQYSLRNERLTCGGAAESPNDLHSGIAKIAPDPETLPSLRFAEAEARKIAALFGKASAAVITGEKASTAALLTDPGAGILHIATHGFSNPLDSGQNRSVDMRMFDRMQFLKEARDPLLRCGLYFAGASNWLHGEELSTPYGNGILLGHDLAVMNLSQYWLVVLSACQTACGDYRTGEGLKGLRHAFELAGVGCLVCALWDVDDFATALLMSRFYKELLIDKMPPAKALARAKQYVKSVTVNELLESGWDEYLNYDVIDQLIGEEKEDYANYLQDMLETPEMRPFAHPRYWAGFIIQGKCSIY